MVNTLEERINTKWPQLERDITPTPPPPTHPKSKEGYEEQVHNTFYGVKYFGSIIIKTYTKESHTIFNPKRVLSGSGMLYIQRSRIVSLSWVSLTTVQSRFHEEKNKAENPSKLVCKSFMSMADGHGTEPQCQECGAALTVYPTLWALSSATVTR